MGVTEPSKLYQLTEVVPGSIQQLKDSMSEISDGYHTFGELYRFRLLYNAAFFNTMWKWEEAEGPQGFDMHKSKRHSDGELCFGGGWFIVVAQLPTGQITNHYELKDWDLFHIPERKKAKKYDGHSPADVEKRLTDFIKTY